jgi:hypothetical protein
MARNLGSLIELARQHAGAMERHRQDRIAPFDDAVPGAQHPFVQDRCDHGI